jgi:uncharacterized tellurite resistance protein B-like protein
MCTASSVARFGNVERVVADPLRFKLKLRIGEDAYTSLRVRRNLSDIWEVGGAAASGAGVAASPIVASTFFPATGMLSWLGLGAAATTPVGWLVAAALASGGAWFGVVRLVRKFSGSRVDTIPKFINTPLDLLAASLLDLVGGLAARLAFIDGHLSDSEREAICNHFVNEWGLDREYTRQALKVLFESAGETRIKQLAASVAQFQASSPDCNAEAMSAELMQFLRELAEADGELDEREELALDAIAAIFREQRQSAFSKLGATAGNALSASTQVVRSVTRRSGQSASATHENVRRTT